MLCKDLTGLICEEIREFARELQSLFFTPLLHFTLQSNVGFHLRDRVGFMGLLIYRNFAEASLNMSWEAHVLFSCAKETRK